MADPEAPEDTAADSVTVVPTIFVTVVPAGRAIPLAAVTNCPIAKLSALETTILLPETLLTVTPA